MDVQYALDFMSKRVNFVRGDEGFGQTTLVSRAAETIPPVLYHYCSLPAFFSIMRENKVWLSQFSSLNDSMERAWLKKLVVERLNSEPEGKIKDDVTYALGMLTESDPYCFSLSEDGDVLSQWRAYADQGQGFAIGFNSRSEWYHNKSALFGPVFYDDKNNNRLIDAFFSENTPDEHRRDWATTGLALFGMFVKNPKFKEELEWRLVQGSPTPLPHGYSAKYRCRGAELVRYLDMEMFGKEGPIVSEIILGPKNPMRNKKGTLKDFLVDHGHENTEIKESEATLK